MQTTTAKQKTEAMDFVSFWKDKGYEKGQTQPFWLSLLRILGIDKPETFIEFEDKAHIDSAHGFIDGYIPATHVLIEQKSLGKSLRAGIPQSDGSLLTPFQQAKRYAVDLPYSRRPRWVVTCNFSEFLLYDMEKPNAEPESLLLTELPEQLYRLRFLVDTGSETLRREEEISKKAGDVVGLIYDALLKQYHNPSDPATLKSLNKLCVRLVFLLYAEDADIFTRLQFHDYLKQFPAAKARSALIELFKVLDKKPEERDPYLDSDLAAFPYVNGGLFADDNVEIPQISDEILDLILNKASEDFDWKDISPTIFGAVFESTLNPETRRSGGMHYTAVANIHKVIDPLFLDKLKAELSDIKAVSNVKKRATLLREYIKRLASLVFLDPACGSGNFLTETYISLRRLENEALSLLLGAQTMLDLEGDMIQVSLSQFHGFEINDFACHVAQTAMWIAENQMMRETERIVHRNLEFLPLDAYEGIVEGNALRLDWKSLVPNASYIIGNPPFVGYSLQSKEQKEDILDLYRDENNRPYKTAGKIDYVAGWYWKASEYMAASKTTQTALVSTNSITQGEQVASVWRPLMERFGISIDFAHRTFRWDSESNSMAHVHCVIVGFSSGNTASTPRQLFDGDRVLLVPHINAYLIPAADIWIESRNKTLCQIPEMVTGNRPADGGFLIIEASDINDFLNREPKAQQFIKRLVGAHEYINNKPRYCLWLVDATPTQLRDMPLVLERIRLCKEDRMRAPDEGRRKLAETPTLFREVQNPKSFILVPRHSSENRRYIPLGFLGAESIPHDSARIIPNATLYHFGILTSNVHNAWMRAVAGRLEMRYRYSAQIVYNNFPWPEVTDAQKTRIEQTAQAILDARAKYPDASLADLYDELTMPPELRTAHQNNNRAVMAAYGFSTKITESECVAELFKLYQTLASSKQGDKV